MVNGFRLRMALMLYLTGKASERPNAIYGPLTAVMRDPRFTYTVRYPIDRATADSDDGEGRFVLPDLEAAAWLYTSERLGQIGPWDSTIARDGSDFTVIVSFERDEDAVLFRMKWL